MDKRIKISNEQKKEMYKLYESGKSTVEIANIFNMNASNVAGYLKRGGITLRKNSVNSRKFICDDNFFNNIDTREKAYWLGFMYADGFLSGTKNVGMNLSSIDRDHIEKFKNSISATYPINEYHVTSGYKVGSAYSRIIVNSEKMHNDLISHGCVRNKTDILKAPSIDSIFYADFIRGYIDGDGSIIVSYRKNHKSLKPTTIDSKVKVLGTDDILFFIKKFIEDNGIATINKFYKRKSDHIVSSLELAGNRQVFNFLNLLYDNTDLFLSRKHDKYMTICDYYC